MTDKKINRKKTSQDTTGGKPQAKAVGQTAELWPPFEPKVPPVHDEKSLSLEPDRVDNAQTALTTNQGLIMAEDEFSLKAGDRGPTLMEDFHYREKMTHFDHERIPERIVHARGSGAYGEFRCTKDMSEYTSAEFLGKEGAVTPVFVRFSTVQGSRGSTDTPRDVRGFAVKFYTNQGNLDIAGNNMPVFFIQDAIKFPDFVHAVKPEPHNEIPQAASAHDTFWDFISQNQESAHQVMWLMSDRAIPASFRMMDGFGVNTFRFVNRDGKAVFVKYHWRAQLGVHALEWDEATKLSGKDTDSMRRDLMDNIDAGNYPVYDFAVQMIPQEDEFKFDFDILDATKLWPEELVPLVKIGEMTLNRNIDNFFAEVEQSAFHPGHLVPGIDFSNDPLLQGRLFSYTDTQLLRLGGPNFHQNPVNRPIVPIHNNQRDGFHMHMIHKGPVSYHKSAIDNQSPVTLPREKGGYEHYQEKVEGSKIRARAEAFRDHFSQAIMFYNSMSAPEKKHIQEAFTFELSRVKRPAIRQNVVNMFANVDLDLAAKIAEDIGAEPPDAAAGFAPDGIQPGAMKDFVSPALSMMNTVFKPDTLKVAVFISDKKNVQVKKLMEALKAAKADPKLVGPQLGHTADGQPILHTYTSAYPVMFDALIVVEPDKMDDMFRMHAETYVTETFRHFKPLWILGTGNGYAKPGMLNEPGVMSGKEALAGKFVDILSKHRFWDRNTAVV